MLFRSGQLFTSTTTYRYYDFNQPVAIEPPLDDEGNLLPGWQIAGSITPDSRQPVFSRDMVVTIGAEPGYNDAAHQQVTFRITLTNQSAETVDNVRLTLSTMATNETEKPAVIEARPQDPEITSFAPDRSETYIASWKFDGSHLSKQEISRLVDETQVKVKFTTQDGRELTELLSPRIPYPSQTPPPNPPQDPAVPE